MLKKGYSQIMYIKENVKIATSRIGELDIISNIESSYIF